MCIRDSLYSDDIIEACAPGCSGNTKVARLWTVLNWCDGQSFNYLQSIEVADMIGPEILVRDFTLSVDPWQCATDVLVPSPEHLRDNCDAEVTYEARLLGGINQVEVTKDGFVILGVEPGVHTVQYSAEDCCGNVTRETVQLTIVDKTPPIPVLIENIIVDLTIVGEFGTAKVFVDNIDNGSFDSCTGVVTEVRRFSPTCNPQDTVWGDFVTFCCDDLKASEFVFVDVEFRVSDWSGNQSISQSTVRLEDKGTAMTCPVDVVLSCVDDFQSFDNTGGVPMLFTACGEIPIDIDTTAVFNNTEPRRKSANEGNVPGFIGVAVPAFDATCGFGAIRRRFDQCTQWIVVEPIGDVFDSTTIVFPQDTTVSCVDVVTGEPIWQEVRCNLVGSSLTTDTFRFQTESCALIVNEWTVIDWCNHNLITGEGSFNFTQTIKLVDNTLPTLLIDEDLRFPTDPDCLSKGVRLSGIAEDTGDCASELLAWTVEVDLFDDHIIDYTYSTSADLLLPNGDPNPFRLERTRSKEQQTILLPDGIMGSKQEHRVVWSVNDGCSNTQSRMATFLIEDQKAPTPYCVNLSTTVMDNGQVELWAIDFNLASFDNCSDMNDLRFTFTDVPPPPRCDDEYDSNAQLVWYNGTYWFYDSSVVDVNKQSCGVTGAGQYKDLDEYGGDVHRWEPGLGSSGKIFTTSDIDPASGLLMIPIYVWDDCQNIDFCTVNLRVTNNNGGASGIVSGKVMTETGQAVEGISASLTTSMPEYPKSKITDAQGVYLFSDNHLNMDYNISGTSVENYLNGVSTLDLVMIQRHILGVESLGSPYKMIAADINADNRINGQDLVELRKLILGIYSELPQNESWITIDADQSLDVASPWNYSKTRVLQDLNDSMMDEDFIGVKIGDVNGDVIANSLLNTEVPQANLGMQFDNIYLLEGESSEVNFRLAADVSGFQMALDFGELEVTEVTGLDEGAYTLIDNVLSVSHALKSAAGSDLFSVNLSANKSAELINNLTIGSQLNGEAYGQDGDVIYRLNLSSNSNEKLVLHPNHPNPFSDYTFVKYELLKDTEVTITLYDIIGSLLREIPTEGIAGMNMVKINREDLESGLILCKVEADGQALVKEMVIVD